MSVTQTLPTIDIQSGITAVLDGRKKSLPCHVNRISALDDPCLRKLYYARHDWEKAAPTPTGLQGVFETGKALEPVIERNVIDVGMASTPRWRIVGKQAVTKDSLLDKYQIGGTCDGFLQVEVLPNDWLTIGANDIKTASPNTYPRLNTYADLARYPWTRKYRGQIMLYALAHNLEQCYLLLANKGNLFDMKFISFPVDMAYCEELLQKAIAVNEAIEAEIPPDKLNDEKECCSCSFRSFCGPDFTTGSNLEIIDNDELESVLDRLAELRPATAEAKDLENLRDALLVKGQDVACGRWVVTWTKTEYHYKSKPATDESTVIQWRKKIVTGVVPEKTDDRPAD